jgi:hypothetical protein
LESGAHQQTILVLRSFPIQQFFLHGWREWRCFGRIRVREAQAFPLEPSSLNSGIAEMAMGCLPLQAAPVGATSRVYASRGFVANVRKRFLARQFT